MRKEGKFSTFILMLTAIILIGIIGALGYAIYNEIIGEIGRASCRERV